MRQPLHPHRRAAALFLAAAALPFTPVAAQEAQPADDPPAQEAPAEPAAEPAASPAAEAQPTPDPTPVATAAAAAATDTSRTATRTTAVRTTRASPLRAPARPAPAPVASAPLPPVAAPAPPPLETLDPAAAAPEVLAETPPAATAPAPSPVRESGGTRSVLPWLLAGLLLLGALAIFSLRRRRRADTQVYDEVRQEHVEAAPAAVAAPVAAAAVAPVEAGRPDLDLQMRPIRAGVGENDARVEFELIVGNKGDAPAQDVRVSTWMLAAGSSEMERSLIEPSDHADTSPVTIAAGEMRTVEAAVAMPIAQVDGDALLPVVVADARYRLPDGSEARTSASFAVGVPVGDELAHFDLENPSGLHEDVEAREIG
jgi:hypothetical protein